MLTQLLRQEYKFSFGDTSLTLRYDLNAFLALEQAGEQWSDIFGREITYRRLRNFFAAGLREHVGPQRIDGIMEALGAQAVWEHCINAMLLAIPKPDPMVIVEENHESGELDFARLRTAVCDVMGKSEEFFWSSTLEELSDRWQSFAILKGYMKPPKKIEKYDTEGML